MKAFAQLVRHDLDPLPVVNRRKLVGMLRRRDVTRWLEPAWRPTETEARAAAGDSTSHPDDTGPPMQGAHPAT